MCARLLRKPAHTSCISPGQVDATLKAGAALGPCGVNAALTEVNRNIMPVPEEGFNVKTIPNPSRGNFNVIISSSDFRSRVTMRVIDILGREVEQRKVSANQTITIGEAYRPGIYIVEVRQGTKHIKIKLVKLSD